MRLLFFFHTVSEKTKQHSLLLSLHTHTQLLRCPRRRRLGSTPRKLSEVKNALIWKKLKITCTFPDSPRGGKTFAPHRNPRSAQLVWSPSQKRIRLPRRDCSALGTETFSSKQQQHTQDSHKMGPPADDKIRPQHCGTSSAVALPKYGENLPHTFHRKTLAFNSPNGEKSPENSTTAGKITTKISQNSHARRIWPLFY